MERARGAQKGGQEMTDRTRPWRSQSIRPVMHLTPAEKRQQAKDMAEAMQKLADALGASMGTGHAIASEFLRAADAEIKNQEVKNETT